MTKQQIKTQSIQILEARIDSEQMEFDATAEGGAGLLPASLVSEYLEKADQRIELLKEARDAAVADRPEEANLLTQKYLVLNQEHSDWLSNQILPDTTQENPHE